MKDKSLKLELVEKMTTLATAGLGFVAGLAWNEAIQDLFQALIPEQSTLVAKFAYAIFVTVLIVLVTVQLSRMADKLKEQLKK